MNVINAEYDAHAMDIESLVNDEHEAYAMHRAMRKAARDAITKMQLGMVGDAAAF